MSVPKIMFKMLHFLNVDFQFSLCVLSSVPLFFCVWKWVTLLKCSVYIFCTSVRACISLCLEMLHLKFPEHSWGSDISNWANCLCGWSMQFSACDFSRLTEGKNFKICMWRACGMRLMPIYFKPEKFYFFTNIQNKNLSFACVEPHV